MVSSDLRSWGSVAALPRRLTEPEMFKALLNAVVILPVLLGILAARTRRRQQGLVQTVASALAFSVFYLLLMYYLRHRWV